MKRLSRRNRGNILLQVFYNRLCEDSCSNDEEDGAEDVLREDEDGEGNGDLVSWEGGLDGYGGLLMSMSAK
jgi:hypothetical protein